MRTALIFGVCWAVGPLAGWIVGARIARLLHDRNARRITGREARDSGGHCSLHDPTAGRP